MCFQEKASYLLYWLIGYGIEILCVVPLLFNPVADSKGLSITVLNITYDIYVWIYVFVLLRKIMNEQNLTMLDLWNPSLMVVWNKRPVPDNVVSFSHNNVSIIQTNDSTVSQTLIAEDEEGNAGKPTGKTDVE